MGTENPQIGNWHRWGEDDERGALNLINPHAIVRAAGLVKLGMVYSMGMQIAADAGPRVRTRPAPVHLFRRDGGDFPGGPGAAEGSFGFADDCIFMPTHVGTHIDALSHWWHSGFLYNGYDSRNVTSSGATRDSIDKIGGIVGRGVLLDVAALHQTPCLETGHAITAEELQACERLHSVTVGSGDIVLIRTGWLGAVGSHPETDPLIHPGLSATAVPWLVERDVAAVGADNTAVEIVPDPDGRMMPVHSALIRDHGVHLMELLQLDDLSAAGHHEFLFVAAPLRIRAGVGSPINPLAVV